MTVLVSPRTMLPGREVLMPGYLVVEGDRIVETGSGRPHRPVDFETSGILSPGFVDVHSHGGGGFSFDDPDMDNVRKARQVHLEHGTTTMIASLVTASYEDLKAQILRLAMPVRNGEFAGIHLEGPWLAPEFKGAHTLELLRDPVPEEVGELVSVGGGVVRMVTIAPELPGGLASISVLAGLGVVAAVGHTSCDYETAVRAVRNGATGATHLFNAMPEMMHRAPGPVLALGEDPGVWSELIFDGVHVSAPLLSLLIGAFPDRVVLVTDAMAAAGAEDGEYTLGGLDVVVNGGTARLASNGAIAGSTLTLDAAVRTAVASGVPLINALLAATSSPAAYLSIPGVGSFNPGNYADAVVLDDHLNVTRVMSRGKWV